MGSIREFSVLKEILDKNTLMLGLSMESLKKCEISKEALFELQSQKFKIIDCKLIYVFF